MEPWLDGVEVAEGLDTGGKEGVIGTAEPDILEVPLGFWSGGGEAIREVPLADKRCY